MKFTRKRLAALVSASIAGISTETHSVIPKEPSEVQKDTIFPILLNANVSKYLAAHRSHSSHSSHRSHRSSSSGSGSSSSRTYSAPVTKPKPSKKKSDPLGQASRPKSSYPSDAQSETLTQKLKNKAARKNIIMRMQLTLQFSGHYKGAIDGIMGPQTRKAVRAFKAENNIPGNTVLDAATLNALGIVGF